MPRTSGLQAPIMELTGKSYQMYLLHVWLGFDSLQDILGRFLQHGSTLRDN